MVALGFLWQRQPVTFNPESVNIEIVDIADKTRMKKQNKAKKPEKGKSKVFNVIPKPKPQKLKVKPELKVRPKEVVSKSNPEDLSQKEKKNPIQKKEVKPLLPEKIKEKPKTIIDVNLSQPKKKPDAFDDVLKAVSDMREKDLDVEKDKKADNTKPNKVTEDAEAFTISDIDILRRQLASCWTPPAGIKRAEEIVVEIDLVLKPDARIKSAEVVDQNRMKRDHTYKIAAEAALRALKHPSCVPLKLPKDKYALWGIFRLVFNPQQMF